MHVCSSNDNVGDQVALSPDSFILEQSLLTNVLPRLLVVRTNDLAAKGLDSTSVELCRGGQHATLIACKAVGADKGV